MSASFEVVSFEAGLWTVGFRRPSDSGWEPVRDHDNPVDALRRTDELNGDGSGYVYLRSEARLWTVGYYVGNLFEPISDHDTEPDAARECARLNGSEVDL